MKKDTYIAYNSQTFEFIKSFDCYSSYIERFIEQNPGTIVINRTHPSHKELLTKINQINSLNITASGRNMSDTQNSYYPSIQDFEKILDNQYKEIKTQLHTFAYDETEGPTPEEKFKKIIKKTKKMESLLRLLKNLLIRSIFE
jgi:hypothetical protein